MHPLKCKTGEILADCGLGDLAYGLIQRWSIRQGRAGRFDDGFDRLPFEFQALVILAGAAGNAFEEELSDCDECKIEMAEMAEAFIDDLRIKNKDGRLNDEVTLN